MFSKTSDHKHAETKRAVNGKCAVPSILSVDARLVGDLTTDGEVHIDGHHQGEVHAKSVHVSCGGTVAGAITADIVHVEGRVDGAIAARAVSLGKSSRVVGDVRHETLAIEPGARLQGQCLPNDQVGSDGESTKSSKPGNAHAAVATVEPKTPHTENRDKKAVFT